MLLSYKISDMNNFRYDHCIAPKRCDIAPMKMQHKSMNKLEGISKITESNA